MSTDTFFTAAELKGLKPHLVAKLIAARGSASIPFFITSGYREGDPLSHGRGLAVDIRCSIGAPRFRILSALLAAGFRRIGIYNRHIHADVDPTLPQDVIWWGVSE